MKEDGITRGVAATEQEEEAWIGYTHSAQTERIVEVKKRDANNNSQNRLVETEVMAQNGKGLE
ncbi:unnamed protein product [Sphenostylis stenocarpa]|uniref:Uncharacterized protein n=1 Tax=Sphenostylis stenocarpa TaxID=92480 RepID=A0AA86VFE8_9FABA|nr:unnamed protein product [Sphenostylis stenocarpa]